MTWKNHLTRILNIEYPMIQAPMFGVTTPEMVAAAAKAGVLGSLSLGDLPADKCRELIQTTKKLTDKPFAVNIFVHEIPELSDALRTRYNNAKQFAENLAKQHQIDVILPDIDSITTPDYHDQVDTIMAEECRIVSFTFGNLDAQSIERLKSHDTVLIGTCTSVEEARILERSGIDLVCVQGIEAGGHRGSFAAEDIPAIGGLSLLAQVYDSVDVPLIYAGGVYNAKTLLAAKTLGAQGVQIGSLLLGSAESALQEFEKEKLRNASESDIVLTRSFSGRYARGIKNAFINAVENSGQVLPYPYQNKLTGPLRKTAKAAGNTDFVSIWAGQSLNGFSSASTTDIIRKLIDEVEEKP
ncbi:NAD(P)H-dependent flavin oxidoreductase [Sinomicrobium weinanense]|uniref:Propionate 3-nitronate monooxygenase n=1 Tax=Sinomicrobium weinanense TaxID=2842200 RepID=A0A926JT51_9FLAO|nr:nitronate monooxygenase family protein [Sinomicrobium weinanense]MBC9796788.1 nitronate monooxygenase [Sinomicrobium weinanense]MBU3125525.1 nitronate monooxygenase family protein [Sinomicrobium weinanense]